MTLCRTAFLLALVAGPILAQDAPPDESPADEIEVELPTVGVASDAEAPALQSVPVPESRPDGASEGEAPADASPDPEAAPAEPQTPGGAPELNSVPVPETRPEDVPTPAEPDTPTPEPEVPAEPEVEGDTNEPSAEAEADPAPDADAPADVPTLIPPEEAAPIEPEAAPAGPPMREILTETPEELAACLAALDNLGVVYAQSEPITEPDNPDCGIANPVTVTEIARGLALEPPPVLRCDTALAAARWAQDVAIPLSRKLGRGDLTVIDQGTATLCRPRADGEMSEHAWGNAIDVMGFRFAEGEPIAVEPRAGDGTLDEAFQRAVRAGACLDFMTVLGPGSDADHADHLHLDIRDRDGGFRICE